MTNYEDRHCALREAEVATKSRSLGLSDEHIAAVEAVDAFEARTGPLVDDLVAAVRDMLNFGEHEGPCARDENGRCAAHVAAMYQREYALKATLAALDEASRG